MKKARTSASKRLVLSVFLGEWTDWVTLFDQVDEYFTNVNKVSHEIIVMDPLPFANYTSSIMPHLAVANEAYEVEQDNPGKGSEVVILLGSTLDPLSRLSEMAENDGYSEKFRILCAHAFYVVSHLARQNPCDIMVTRGQRDSDLAQKMFDQLETSADPQFITLSEDINEAAQSLVDLIDQILLGPEEEWTL